ncbi:MAG: hypothetical protein A2275_02460 [Bacteroidetes bacterium RIFOXYA12_FULL_35_11]|nr:MAG: hypothetical protein A2X01_01515 [Bacteroidetes bacterium GWF2_35_48]OFY74086.1 MAG: hypothetical protein A2275_02460 [Bacteroidetes bacterium RIFOXYA12_FULL_35_11]OFY95341.1 MAG: hypothetical protein A2309_11350 [Bacteroidetes bacterium RIFOXYB2_FULL_35_7]OFZ03292.1 MAG: hypothetical protein A2491_18425 [Bacteroidetes bacterium RIFOXYC12_FULL_35_7]HBX51893.1 hypothetical protein [Bacteroidales bacterium]
MKKVFTRIALIFFLSFLINQNIFAQSPQSFRYQAIARNAAGNVLANQHVSFRISLLQGSVSGTLVYSETHTDTTNQFGLVTLAIGGGAVVSGSFASINWAGGSYFVKVELDAAGGSNYVEMGTSQLLSVPYALYAKETEQTYVAGNGISISGDTISNSTTGVTPGTYGSTTNVPVITVNSFGRITNAVNQAFSAGITGSGTSNYIPKFSGSTSISTSQIFDDGNYVGIGTTSPSDKLHVVGRIRQEQPYNGTSFYMNITGGANGLGIWHSGSSGIPFQIQQSNTGASSNTMIITNDGMGRTLEIQQNNSSNPNSMIYIAKSGTGKVIDVTNGAFLSNGGVWTNASDKLLKENFTEVSNKDILSKIDLLPITVWNYKSEPGVKHIGPMSQDFYNLFNLGNDDKAISTIDPAGVALAAIKELNKKIKELEALKKQVEELELKISKLETIRK